jgi:hypothetical protein
MLSSHNVNIMNLQEALNYRTTCLIHGKLMHLKCLDASAKKIQLQENGVKLMVRNLSKSGAMFPIFFNFNGTVSHIDNQPTKPAIWYFIVQCEDCATISTFSEMASAKNADTSLKNVRRRHHFYSFDIQVKDDNTFTCIPELEVIRYHRDDKFYHVIANLVDGSAKFKMGNCNSSEIINQLLSSLMCLDVPKFDPTTIKSLDGFVSKVKIFNLFS